MAVEQQNLSSAMKAGMRHLAGGVAVVATRGADGVPHAMTVTSITSVSDAPASLLVCLNRDSATYRSLGSTDLFSVSVLHQDQQSVSDRCAFTPERDDRFLIGDWQDHTVNGVPYLPHSLVSFLCRVSRKIDYGTHCIVVGDIETVLMDEDTADPLIYFRGAYTTTAGE